MKFLSVCSGIEAASVAWHPLGWESVAYSEIEPFPCKVLQHHYPDVPNLGDMTKFKEWPDADVDVFVGGTPCQSFSVAGLRKGLDDPRGNLMLVYLAIAKRYRPNWLVWENVPGVLSSAGGRDFGSFLGGLAILGYGFAYRVLDAQYFGVAQRRRRVFVVGYLGDWRPAAAVLFERHSLSGHPAPSREKGKSFARDVREGAQIGRWPADVSSTLDTTFGTKMGLENQHVNAGCPMFVPAQPIALAENTIGRKPENGGNGDGFTDGGPMYTLNATGVHGVAQPIAFSGQMSNPQTDVDMTQTLGAKNPMAVATHDVAGTMLSRNTSGGFSNSIDYAAAGYMALQAMAVMQPIAYAFDSLSSNSMKSSNPDSGVNQVDVSKTLDTSRGLDPSCHQGGLGLVQAMAVATSVVAPTLTAANDPSRSPQSSEVTQQVYSVLQASMAVRRLTPVECERLQGFGDNYTDIQPKGKATPDGPRYKALGNSMAVPVMAWIGKRIQEVDALL